jgi:hypothetical protein
MNPRIPKSKVKEQVENNVDPILKEIGSILDISV